MKETTVLEFVVLLATRSEKQTKEFLTDPDINFSILDLLSMLHTAEKLRVMRLIPILNEVINLKLNEYAN